ncbi:MAG: S46 family peptidase [Acidobacteria bacterium]|nr:S46 family peptidase [Acidobacteriota bacterium]
MPFLSRQRAVLVVAVALSALAGRADEGMWPPDQIGSLDWDKLRARGMELEPADIWGPDGSGLAQAVINLEGCTGSFVSPDGLFLSNHHCLLDAIQEHSSAGRDLLAGGFVARSRSEELPATGGRALVLRRVEDVTKTVTAAAEAARDDVARQQAIERAGKELVAACETRPGTRCRVGAYYGGLRYVLFESLEIRDVRLVYAPPEGVGDFGGEVDNWSWPRHTGDFAMARAYVAPDGAPAATAGENVPFRPRSYLRVSARGVRPGEIVAVFGYPGKTERYLPAVAVRRDLEWWFPRREEVFGDWLRIGREAAARSPEAAIRLAAVLDTAGNVHKNAQGMIAGMRRNRVLERATERDRELRAWVTADPARQARFGKVLDKLEQVYRADESTREKDFLLRYMPVAVKTVGWANTLLRWSREQTKPDLQREPGYQERDRERLRTALEQEQKDYEPFAEREVLAYFLGRALDLPADQRLAAVDRLLAPALRPGADRAAVIREYAGRVVSGTGLSKAETRLSLFGAPRASLDKSGDPALELSRALEAERDAWEQRQKAQSGALARLRPRYSEMLIEWRGGAVYPDANSTLRMAIGTVKGYSPRDGIFMLPQTTLDGMLEKHTGVAPFNLPARVRDAARTAEFGRWAQDDLGGIPVDFLADSDTTGGNSGSPVVNGRGELVGLNFDRVWENIAGDYGWSPVYSRHVSVDVRFLMWFLERVDHADNLLQEIGGPDK